MGKKDKGNDDDLPDRLRRDKGKSADDFIKGLGAKRQFQICGTCRGAGQVQVKKASKVNGKVVTETVSERCKTCGGVGKISGGAR